MLCGPEPTLVRRVVEGSGAVGSDVACRGGVSRVHHEEQVRTPLGCVDVDGSSKVQHHLGRGPPHARHQLTSRAKDRNGRKLICTASFHVSMCPRCQQLNIFIYKH